MPQVVAQLDDLPVFAIPWGHNALILEKVKNTAERLWYAQKAIEHGWSRSMLTIWIEKEERVVKRPENTHNVVIAMKGICKARKRPLFSAFCKSLM